MQVFSAGIIVTYSIAWIRVVGAECKRKREEWRECLIRSV